MQACTQWTHSDVWSQLATTPECLFKIGDSQREKKWRNGDRRAICNVTRGIDARHWVIRHRGVSAGSDGARPLWRSHPARTEMSFADAHDQALKEWEVHTLEHMKWNDNHQHTIKDWSRDIVESIRWLMCQLAYAELHIYTPQHCFNSDTPPKRLYTAMHSAYWWWDTQLRRDSRGWWSLNWR